MSSVKIDSWVSILNGTLYKRFSDDSLCSYPRCVNEYNAVLSESAQKLGKHQQNGFNACAEVKYKIVIFLQDPFSIACLLMCDTSL